MAPKSLTFLISASRSGIVRAVGAPAAGKRKFVKLVSAWARDAASAPTVPPNKSRRPMICVLIVHLPFCGIGQKVPVMASIWEGLVITAAHAVRPLYQADVRIAT